VSSPTTTLEGGHTLSPPHTAKTGQGARLTTPSETLPTTSRFTAFSPRLPIMSKPTPNSSASEPPGAEVECPADEPDAARKVEQIQGPFVAQSHGPSKELYGQRLLQCSKPHQEMPGTWRAIGR
jgi:hypothetical protein